MGKINSPITPILPKTPVSRAPPPTSLKRRSAVEGEPSSKRPKLAKKPTQTAEGMSAMADAIVRLGDSFLGPANTSPEKRRAAIKLIEDDGELDSGDEIESFQLIRRDSRMAEMILSISKKEKRARYLRLELKASRSTMTASQTADNVFD